MAKKHCKLQIFIAIFIVKLEHFLSEFIITKYEHKYFKSIPFVNKDTMLIYFLDINTCSLSRKTALLFLEMKEGTPYIKLHFVPFDI